MIAGNAMTRRATYMFGLLLPRNASGSVTAGLGQTASRGTITLIAPTDSIEATGDERTIDGVRMVFQMTPGTEAPVEMNTWFPAFKALWMAENATDTLHNILTLRGAQVRDALKWSDYLDEAIELYGREVEVKFQSHHWPCWGNARVVDELQMQRDVYKYLHDQSVHLMNQGYVGEEIAEMIRLPPELERNWSTRGYYGTMRHNSRAVYQRYMGWYDGNPASLDPLPPVEAGKKFVEYMGGEDAVLARVQRDYEHGEYRWVAQVLKQVVFANPANAKAKGLLADAFEQLGYQAESASWRNVYLVGAYELRNGTPTLALGGTASPDVIRAMPPDMMFDYMAVRLNAGKAAGRTLGLNFKFTDLDQSYGVSVENGVLIHGRPLESPDATLALGKDTLNAIQLGTLTVDHAIASGALTVTGRREALADLMSLLDTFPAWFNIVTP